MEICTFSTSRGTQGSPPYIITVVTKLSVIAQTIYLDSEAANTAAMPRILRLASGIGSSLREIRVSLCDMGFSVHC